MLTWGAKYWPVFLIITSTLITLGFGIPELIALVTQRSTHTDNTLSNYAWKELGVTDVLTIHTLAWWFTFVPWLAFVVIITLHIWYRQFT